MKYKADYVLEDCMILFKWKISCQRTAILLNLKIGLEFGQNRIFERKWSSNEFTPKVTYLQGVPSTIYLELIVVALK